MISIGSQIILSQKLAIQNNNYTQEHKYYVENPFFLKGKTMRKTLNNFTSIKSITIILVYVSRLKKISLVFLTLTHTNYFSQMQQHFTLSFLFSFSCTTLSWLSSFLLADHSWLLSLFFLVRLPLSLLVHILSLCLLDGGNPLLSPSSCVPSK